MKKIIISMMAVAALAACTKSEVAYDAPAEIGFVPVASNITKSVAGLPNGNSYDASFPTSQNLYIFANSQNQDANGTLLSTWTEEYMKNAKFIFGRLVNGVYEGEEAYYWPNVKSLIFAGYSSACNIAEIANNSTVDFANNTITINGYIQDNTQTGPGANDLMWFPYDGNSYDKTAASVSATMKHACSWITVKVIGDATTGENYLLKSLTINGLNHKGNVVCGATSAEWNTLSNVSSEVLFSSTDGVKFPLPTDTNGAKVFENVANNMVVLPQTPTTIDITYSYVPQEGVEPITEIVKGKSLKISDTEASNKWESGKHYVYTITITATEILVAPTVSEWTTANVTPGTTI